MTYWVNWIDVYKGGYRSGCTHATDEISNMTLCGIDWNLKPCDGGLQTTDEILPECKKCLVKLDSIKNET